MDNQFESFVSHLTNEELFETISKNPWDRQITEYLLSQARDPKSSSIERSPKDSHLLPTWITTDGYIDMVRRMSSADTLEAKQRLLAETAPIHPAFQEYYKPYKQIIWYDATAGFIYTIHPEKPGRDPFGPRPDSVYDSINNALGNSRFSFQHGIDLGSGSGETTRILAKHCPHVIAMDAFPFWHDVARKRAAEKEITNIEYVTADILSDIPAADHSMDVALSNGLTAFIPPEKIEAFITELARVLKPEGSYFEPEIKPSGMMKQAIQENVSKNPKTLLSYLIGELAISPEKNQTGGYPHSSSRIEGMFRHAGFGTTEFGSTYDSYYTGVSVMQFRAPK